VNNTHTYLCQHTIVPKLLQLCVSYGTCLHAHVQTHILQLFARPLLYVSDEHSGNVQAPTHCITHTTLRHSNDVEFQRLQQGGSASQILRRRAVIHASLRTQLSTALAREVSERVFAYIRGARRFHGRIVNPVSALLL
jgi:hypothetical protein